MTLVALTRDPEALAFAHRMMGFTLWVAGESADAAPLFERVIALYKPGQRNVTDLRYSQDHAVWALSTLALSLWHLGFPNRAAEASSRSLSWADRIGHSMTTGFALSFGSILNGLLVADPERDYALSEKVLSYCSQHDLKAYLPWATFYRGLALARNGQPIQGIGLMREGMANAEQIRMKMAWSIHLGHLAFVHALLGELDAALNTMEQALLAVADTGERAFEAELYRMKAMLLLKSCRAEEAEEALNDGIVIARRQRARMWELRIATMLARIRAHQGQPESARSLLQPVVAWFREGFESPDLREAGALLHTLS